MDETRPARSVVGKLLLSELSSIFAEMPAPEEERHTAATAPVSIDPSRWSLSKRAGLEDMSEM